MVCDMYVLDKWVAKVNNFGRPLVFRGNPEWLAMTAGFEF
jgi:hypothetical protein